MLVMMIVWLSFVVSHPHLDSLGEKGSQLLVVLDVAVMVAHGAWMSIAYLIKDHRLGAFYSSLVTLFNAM